MSLCVSNKRYVFFSHNSKQAFKVEKQERRSVKRASGLLISFLFMFAPLVAASSETNHTKAYKVITTFTIFADIAQQVAGEHANVVSITKAGAEIHNYQPTPKDIVKTQNADLILWHGMNLELWFEKFYRNISHIPRSQLTKGIEPLSIHGGAYAGKPNPHAWMSAKNAEIYIENIRIALTDLDPTHAADYRENANRYLAEVNAVMLPYQKQLNDLPEEQRWLVSSEGAFSYLARDFGLKELFIWPINADSQGSPQQMRKVIDVVKKHKIVAVFSESTVSDKPAKQVAREAGSQYGGVLYVDSLSGKEGPVPTYLALLNETAKTIVSALTQSSEGKSQSSDKE